MLDSGAVGPGFKSQPPRCRVTVLGKLFIPIVPLFTKQRNWYQPTGLEDNCGLAESNGTAQVIFQFDIDIMSHLTIIVLCCNQSCFC